MIEPNKAGGLAVSGDSGNPSRGTAYNASERHHGKGLHEGLAEVPSPRNLVWDAVYRQPVDLWATRCIISALAAMRPMSAAIELGVLATLTAIVKS